MLPLCVDLDGTLVRSDTLHEQYLNALVRRPFAALLVVALLLRGKAAFKRGLNQLSPVNPESLPYQLDLLDFHRRRAVVPARRPRHHRGRDDHAPRPRARRRDDLPAPAPR
jgi:hypothetical protein